MSETSEIQDRDKCHHDPCHCVPGGEEAVVVDKSVFCSPGCAAGDGCDHRPCCCREVS